MSIKNLFKTSGDVISKKSLSDLTSTYNLESYGVISSSYSRYNLLPPNIDFSQPSSFAKYGSAEHYYDASIKRIADTYPYDGSTKQKLEWRNNASYLDLHLYNNEYPKYTGSADIGYTFGSVTALGSGVYYTSVTEYIFVPKGLGLYTKHNSESDRTSSFSFDKESGFCTEFWFKKNGNVSTSTSSIIHAKNSIDYLDAGHFGFLIYNKDDDFLVKLYNNSSYSEHILNDLVITDEWNHFSVNIYTASSPKIDIWMNGAKLLSENITYGIYPQASVDTSFSGTIGATLSSSIGVGLGYQRVSGSFDDFRFWRRKRTDSEIIKNWFTTVDGGFDSDELLNPDMGFYYKFNEKLYGTASIDSIVRDYSGRKNNGKWIGYLYGNRNSESPIDNEKADVIMNFSSSDVYSFYSDKIAKGLEYDRANNGCIINNLPDVLKKDNLHYINLTQIISSIFDSLFLEIQALSSIKDNSAFVSGSIPSDILLRLINSNGLDLNGVLDSYSLSEIIESKNDEFAFTSDIEKIKQVIYKNIYNSLTDIYKAKGTEKSIKSIFRSFGVDDDVLKIKSYSKEGEIQIDGSKRIDTVRRKNLLDLYGYTDEQNMNGSLYLQYCNEIDNSINYLSNSFSPSVDSNNINSEKTFEANILFPVKHPLSNVNHVFLNQNSLSASLFGFVQVADDIAYNSPDSTWAASPNKLNVFCVQKDRYNKDAKFVLEFTGTNYTLIHTETNWIEDVYDNTKWTFAVKVNSSNKYSDQYQVDAIYTTSLTFIGLNEEGGRIINSFSSTFDLNYSGPVTNNNLLSCKIKPYVGALRTNFSGTVLHPTQAKFYSFRAWRANLDEEDIINHSYDVHNFGISKAYENSYSIKDSIEIENYNEFIPKNELLLINWDFEAENYIPNSNGVFTESSFRSSSLYTPENTIYKNIQYNFPAVGVGFNSGSVVLDKNYAIEQKNRVPTDYYSYDDISLIDDQNKYFGKRIKPVEYFYTIENSIYSVISEDILNMFSSIKDFNNLFGMTHEKYRSEYKSLRLFRKLFFSKIRNEKIDIQRYFSYYKWLDSAIEAIAKNLFPLSANADSNVRNVIESHVLERPKHRFIPEIIKHKPKINLIFNMKSVLNSVTLNDLDTRYVAPERHALSFDGLVDRAYAEDVRTGVGTTYSFITKVSSTAVSGADSYISHLSIPGNTAPAGANISDVSRRVISTGQRYSIIGLTSGGVNNYARTSASEAVIAANTSAVYAVGRDLTGNTARGRVVGTDGIIRWTFTDIATIQDSIPLDLVIGCATNYAFTPYAGTYYAIGWVASVVLDIIPTDVQLQDYAAGVDARVVWPTNIVYYVAASSLVGLGSGPIPPLIGSSNLTLVGPVEGDLVSYG